MDELLDTTCAEGRSNDWLPGFKTSDGYQVCYEYQVENFLSLVCLGCSIKLLRLF
jgi:hypothetical protein